MKSLPRLYKTTGVGRTQTWQIFIDGSQTFTKFGPEGGVIQESAREQSVGKNAGKTNGTTPAQQAQLDAESKWRKKLGSGYVQTLAELKAGAVDARVGGGWWPMLARVFKKEGRHIQYPAYVQPKYNGHRCSAPVDERSKCALWTRKRKPRTSVPHIVKALEDLGVAGMDFDGELYNHDLREGKGFEKLTHIINQQVPIEGHEAVEFHIYDLHADGTFEERLKKLTDALKNAKLPLVLSETLRVENEDELILAFEHYRELGYEGAMVRNRDGKYLSHPTYRSKDLQKIKEFFDDEFKVVDVKEGKGKMAGHAVFVVATENGTTTDAKMKGKLSDLRQYWDHPERVIGKSLTVQYQGHTGSGKLLFPVALRIRED